MLIIDSFNNGAKPKTHLLILLKSRVLGANWSILINRCIQVELCTEVNCVIGEYLFSNFVLRWGEFILWPLLNEVLKPLFIRPTSGFALRNNVIDMLHCVLYKVIDFFAFIVACISVPRSLLHSFSLIVLLDLCQCLISWYSFSFLSTDPTLTVVTVSDK